MRLAPILFHLVKHLKLETFESARLKNSNQGGQLYSQSARQAFSKCLADQSESSD